MPMIMMNRMIITTLSEIQPAMTVAATRDEVNDPATTMVAGNPPNGHGQTRQMVQNYLEK